MPASRHVGQRCNRIDDRRGSDNDHDVSVLRGGGCPSKDVGIQRLAEPHDVGSKPGPAPATEVATWCCLVVEDRKTTIVRASHLPQVAVQFQRRDAPRPLVQAVNVLSQDAHARTPLFQPRNRQVPIIR